MVFKPYCFVISEVNFIIGSGPMATHSEYFSPASISCFIFSVTRPFSPYEPSSVIR